jgi:hypothetical protein
MRNLLAVVTAGIVLFTAAAFGQEQKDSGAIVRILNDRSLWGEDFYRLLPVLSSFQKAGEQRIVIFADRVVGTNRYRSLREAETRNRALESALQRGDQPLAGAARRLYQVQQPIAMEPTAIQFLDDRSFRVAAPAPNGQLLPAGLKIATVQERLGKPEKVTKELLDDGTERRPVILTVYYYAGGAIAFVESNIAPRPGFVNRVYLDVPAVTSALLKGGPQ